jgi:hypothetical protein
MALLLIPQQSAAYDEACPVRYFDMVHDELSRPQRRESDQDVDESIDVDLGSIAP